MKTATLLQEQGYKGVKVTSMIQACLSVEIRQHLRLVQLDNLSSIKNKHFKLGYISKPEMTLLWNIYWNFVLNDYRFNDKSKEYTIVTGISKAEPKHIGMQKLSELQTKLN
jgi:hypothetical protein